MIEGTRVRLRVVEHADPPKLHEWQKDPETTQGITQSLPLFAEDEERRCVDALSLSVLCSEWKERREGS